MSVRTKFNRNKVIEKAKDLYWEKGYYATSMRNLQDVIDMRPGSIYATFGSKDNLFKEALNCYAENNAKQLADCLSQEETVLGGLKQFIRKVTICNNGSAPSGMCMIVKSLAELTEADNPDLHKTATTIFGRVETSFTHILQQAIDRGEINKDKNSVKLARYLQVQLIGLRTYAQATQNVTAIESFIDDIFESLEDKF